MRESRSNIEVPFVSDVQHAVVDLVTHMRLEGNNVKARTRACPSGTSREPRTVPKLCLVDLTSSL